jgi:hypothetical protein
LEMARIIGWNRTARLRCFRERSFERLAADRE